LEKRRIGKGREAREFKDGRRGRAIEREKEIVKKRFEIGRKSGSGRRRRKAGASAEREMERSDMHD
jgi:hypothetical protein